MPHPPAQPAPGTFTPRFADLMAVLVDAVVNSPGHLEAERRAAFAGEPLAGAAGEFAEKVRRHAYRVTEEDFGALRRDGMDEDAIFELAIACAVGEAHARLRAGLQALGYDG